MMNKVSPVATPYDECQPGVYQASIFKVDTPRTLVYAGEDKWFTLAGDAVPAEPLKAVNATLYRVEELSADSRLKDITTLIAAFCMGVGPVVTLAPLQGAYWVGMSMTSLGGVLVGFRAKGLFARTTK